MTKITSDLSSRSCGCNLKHGTVFIGVVQSILSFAFMVLTAAYAEHPKELFDLNNPSILIDHHTLQALLILISIVSAVQCVFSIMIIFGVETNRPLLLLPWLIFNPIAIGVYVIGSIAGLIHHNGLNNYSYVIGHLTVGLAVCLIGSCNIFAVYRYYKHLKTLNF